MFVPRGCKERGCGRPALSGSDKCVVHHGDVAAHVQRLIAGTGGRIVLRDLDLTGIRLTDTNFTDAELTGCRFTAATFVGVTFRDAQIHLSFLDRATFEHCDFTGATLQNAVCAGSEFLDCTFCDCEVVQTNFLGIHGVGTSFDHSNLYGSRFVGSVLERVSMRDCNLTRAYFDLPHRESVDFRSSNTNEAVYVEPLP